MCSTNQPFSLHDALFLDVRGPIQPLSSSSSSSMPSSSSWKIQAHQPTQTMIKPRPLDILCGKSKRCVDHGGSRRFRSVIECYKEKYQQALTKWDKTSVTRTIYDHLSQAGSRFLKYNESLKIWEEISPIAARDKIGHALRFANRVTRRKRDAKSIGVDGGQQQEAAAAADLPITHSADAPTTTTTTTTTQPHHQAHQPLLVLGGNTTTTTATTTTLSSPLSPPSSSQPLHSEIQQPLLSCTDIVPSGAAAAAAVPIAFKTPSNNLSELLESLRFATTQTATTTTNTTTPTQTQTTAQATGSTSAAITSAVLGLNQLPLQAPSGMLTQSFTPLGRSQQWYQTTTDTTTPREVEDLKITNKSSSSKPALTAAAACSLSLDDSFSFLDEIIFPTSSDHQTNTQEEPPVSSILTTTTTTTATCSSSSSSSSSNDDICLGDFDFDNEILSVIF